MACLLCATLTSAASAAETIALRVFPERLTLHGKADRQQLLVTATVEGRDIDQTRRATYSTPTPDILEVNARGIVTALGNGTGKVLVQFGGTEAEVPVTVTSADQARTVSFELDVMPILTRHGCNAGACHGKARGQNGFALSLLGFYPDQDYDALAKEGRGRRVFPPSPNESLLLQKAAGLVPHGGGKRLDPEGLEYELLLRWIDQGMPRTQPTDPVLQRVEVYPRERLLVNDDEQQLVVTAFYSDGTQRDVTALSAFQSNESAVVAVDERGLVKAGPIPGEAAIMARFMGLIDICNVMIPLPGKVPEDYYASLPRYNFIDEHVWTKLERLGITPSEPADESTLLRRLYLDIIGRLPTPDEVRSYLADTSSDKRAKLIDALLERPEYADHWANKWADLLRPNPYRVGIKAVLNYDAWIRNAFRKNIPYDQFVRELVTAKGSTWHNGATTLYRDRREPDEITTIISQLFLGVRLECAKCHHHPFERYGQEDFYGFAAYFARLGRKGRGISAPISGSEEMLFIRDSGSVKHPLTGEVLEPKPLFGTAPPVDAAGDPREALAAWMTADDNPFFSQVIANRIWADIMGRGLVDPVDDLRATNPPTNGPLLEALAQDLRSHNYNLKHLIRTICSSYVYGLSSEPSERNVADTRNYSRHYRQRLRAETLLDATCDITGVPENFSAMPPKSRATEIWTHRIGSLFLDSFGRPDPNQDPPCERTGETTVVQTLHLMNSATLHQKVTSDSGRAAQLAASDKTPREITEELYLLAYSRFPTEEEYRIGEELFAESGISRRQATEDLMWALINTPELIFKN